MRRGLKSLEIDDAMPPCPRVIVLSALAGDLDPNILGLDAGQLKSIFESSRLYIASVSMPIDAMEWIGRRRCPARRDEMRC